MKKFLTIVIMSLVLSACATARYDKPKSIIKIDDSTYRVKYVAINDKMDKLRKYILIKGAELSIQEGYNYFSLLYESNKTTMTDIGLILNSEAEIKMYKLKPNQVAGIYNAFEVMKNLGTEITKKDLKDKKFKVKDNNKIEETEKNITH